MGTGNMTEFEKAIDELGKSLNRTCMYLGYLKFANLISSPYNIEMGKVEILKSLEIDQNFVTDLDNKLMGVKRALEKVK